MSLSGKTINNIASAMTEDAIDFIEKDDRWAEVMIEMLTDFVAEKLVTQDTELTCELACCLMDRIYFTKSNL
jgi:transcription antitermination factor NusA-like protein